MSPSGTAKTVASPPLRAGATWSPVVGEEATSLIARQTKLDGEARERTIQTAAAILSRGQDPQAASGRRTGLVVGYVQSGKTLSFTTVIALARDNNIPLVVVIAGTSVDLFRQTRDRLSEDLRIDEDDIPPSWMHLSNPRVANEDIVRKILRDWRDPEIPREECSTLLLTVMKQHQRLNSLIKLLEKLDLAGVPAIIVDDEADQASLNNKVNDNDESPTYQRILDLRGLFQNHTFLQYTATPQAPLLINIIDALSPDFPEVLAPGEGYVGGVQFFGPDHRYVKPIPPSDIPTRDTPLQDVPQSLVEALAFFFVSVAVGLIEGRSKANPNRSMLVHPSRTTQEHFQYYRSITNIVTDWLGLLVGPETEPDRADLIGLLQAAYGELGTTADGLPGFEDVVQRLPRALRETQVREVNRRSGAKPPTIEWKQAYAWILVGGQAMDRGFTVRELSVTYMPRGAGVGNADTLQQRARFFGYKAHYFGHCRLYLESAALDAFRRYVEHEEEMRRELLKVQESGTPLSAWKRRFILDPALRPCRDNVIAHDYGRGNYSDQWFHVAMVRMSEDVIAANNAAVDAFVARYPFEPDTTYVSDQPAQQHLVSDQVPLSEVVGELLLKYRVQDASDSANIIGLMLQLEKACDEEHNPKETAVVYRMRPEFTANRGIDDQGRIPTVRRLHQGPTRTEGGYSYPGDRAFFDLHRVSVQVHHFDLTDESGGVVARSVPVLAIWVPKRLEIDWVAQDQLR